MNKIINNVNKNKIVSFCNLGCKVNAYETEALIQKFKAAGFKITGFGSECDVCVINTCTVTGMADKKSRQMIHRAKKISPDALIVAIGCFVQVMSDEDKQKETDIDLFVGNKEKANLVEIVQDYLNKNSDEKFFVSDINHEKCEYEDLTLKGTTKHTRAYVKIQDGCNQFCSYCLIPYARGRVRSKKIDVIKNEIKDLLDSDYKEIVLTGIHIGSYGMDCDSSLNEVIKMISTSFKGNKKFRLRLGSLEPRTITEEFLENLKSIKEFCPHFHLSLQSGCDETLSAMNRKYSAGEFKDKCELIRKYFENASLTTDVIVGFPGETEEDFEESFEFVKGINFAKTHIFKYSKRKGTRAERFDNQVSEEIKNARSAKMIELDKINHAEYIEKFKNKKQEILIEESKEIDGLLYDVGHTKEYLQFLIPINESEKDMRDNEFVEIMFDERVKCL